MLEKWTEAVVRRCSVKNVLLEISQNSQENTRVRASFLIKLQKKRKRLKKRLIEKETLAQVFSCEFCEISKNTFSYRTPPWAAPEWDNSLFQEKTLSPLLNHQKLLIIPSFQCETACVRYLSLSF